MMNSKKLFLCAALVLASTQTWPSKPINPMLAMQINFAQQAFAKKSQELFNYMKAGDLPKVNETLENLKTLITESIRTLKTLPPEQQKVILTEFFRSSQGTIKQSLSEFITNNTLSADTKNKIVQALVNNAKNIRTFLQENITLELLTKEHRQEVVNMVLQAIPAGIQFESIEPLFTMIFSSQHYQPTVDMLRGVITMYVDKNITAEQQELLMRVATLLLDLGAKPNAYIIELAQKYNLNDLAALMSQYSASNQ